MLSNDVEPGLGEGAKPQMSEEMSFFFIGDLATRLGISPVTIRFYEKEGLIAPGRVGRFRTYRSVDETRLRSIIDMRNMGFSIVRIRMALDVLGKELPNCDNGRYAAILRDHFVELQSRKQQLEREIAATELALSGKGC
jgi:DNA-binding transcriptional MerR regulator